MLSVHLYKRRCRSAEHVRGGSFRVLSFWVNVPVKNRRLKKIKISLRASALGGYTIQYNTLQCMRLQYMTLHYSTFHYIANCNTLQNITLHYIQKDKHTLHTLHTKNIHTLYITYTTYITLHSIPFHCITFQMDGRTYIRKYICHEKYQKRKSLPKKKQSIPM